MLKDRSLVSPVMFDPAKCTNCGLCFSQCPVLELPRDMAKAQIEKLRTGQPADIVNNCIPCFSCNSICPNGANPHDLILDRWFQRYKEIGLPPLAHMVVPTERPNLWSTIQNRLPKDERQQLARWSKLRPAKEMIFPGCNTLLIPYIAQTSLLADLPIMGMDELCCGGFIYQMGIYDAVEQIAQRLVKQLNALGLNRMIVFCTGCYGMFKSILPKFGAEFDFEIVHIMEWLRDEIDNGRITIDHPVKKAVTVHDPCFSKPFGSYQHDLVRDLIELCGAEVYEMEHNRARALCCGIGAGAASYDIFTMADMALRRYDEAVATGAEQLMVYCSACTYLLTVARTLSPQSDKKTSPEIFHILELLQQSTGGQPAHRHVDRSWDFIRIVTEAFLLHPDWYLQSRKYPTTVSKQNFHMQPILPEIDEPNTAEDMFPTAEHLDRLLQSWPMKRMIRSVLKTVIKIRSA